MTTDDVVLSRALICRCNPPRIAVGIGRTRTAAMTLDELLDLHVRVVRQVAKTVEPDGDLAPMLEVWRNGKLVTSVLVPLEDDHRQRQAQHEGAMSLLAELRADAYTMTLSMWTTKGMLSMEEYHEHVRSGQRVADREDRCEGVICLAGDRERTLSAEFLVVRTPSGRISHLQKRETPPGIKMGLFHDMLLRVPAEEMRQ